MASLAYMHIIAPMPDWSPYLPDPALSGGQFPYPQRRGPSWLLIAGVVMLVVAIGVGGYAVYDNRALLFPPVAPTPVATPPPTTNALALATASPSASADASQQATSEATDAAGQPTTAVPSPPQGDVIDLFLANMEAPDLSYHLDLYAKHVWSDPDISGKLTISLDRAGADYKGTMKGIAHLKATFHFIVKDGVEYGRLGSSPWVRASDPAPDIDLLAPVVSAERSFIEDLGVESHGGEKLHHLVVLEADSDACSLSNNVLDIWVRADGQPVSATIAFTCTNHPGRGRFEWSNFGEHVIITAPHNVFGA